MMRAMSDSTGATKTSGMMGVISITETTTITMPAGPGARD
jgi:hypothetical protein